MACVRKRRGKYVVDWRDGAGVRRWKTFDKKTDADAHRDKVGPEARQRVTSSVPASITLKGYAEHWKQLIGHSVKSRTLTRYSEILTQHIFPRFEKVAVQNWSEDLLSSCSLTSSTRTSEAYRPEYPCGIENHAECCD